MPPHSLTKFEIHKYYQSDAQLSSKSKPKFNAYVRNIDEHKSIGTHWIGLYVNNNNVTYFESFGVELIPK